MNHLKKKARKSIAIIVSVVMTLSLLTGIALPENTTKSQAATYGLSNPTTDASGLTTWDTVYFGNYYQSDATGTTKDPIRWRVLSVNGDDAFLLADQNLDAQPYNTEYTKVTWETCTLRTWLNNTFLSTAFTSAEQAAIKNTTVVNEDNPYYNTEGGNNTTDKVYLLSIAEVCNTSYGFNGEFTKESETRVAKNTAYAKEQGAYTSTSDSYAGNGAWWLRSPGGSSYGAAVVSDGGYGHDDGGSVGSAYDAVRPALHLNLSSSNLWSNGGKVTASGGGGTTPTPTPTSTNLLPKKNTTKTIGALKYKVTKSAAKNGTVAVTGVKSKKAKSLTVPSTVKINGYTFKVIAINTKAFMNCKKLTKLTIKSTYIQSVGKNAIKGTNKKLVIKVPKKQLKKYKNLFNKKAGFAKGKAVK